MHTYIHTPFCVALQPKYHQRVSLFLQAKDGTWKSYKDKVYSLNGRKKEFTLTALNVNIKPYV